MKILYTLIFLLMGIVVAFGQDNSSFRSDGYILGNKEEAEQKRKVVYDGLVLSRGKAEADRIISGDLRWGDDETAVLEAHWWESGAAEGHYNVQTPLGKAFQWYFALSDISYYLIDGQLVGITYPASQPQWLPKGYNLASKPKVAHSWDSWGDELTSSSITATTNMNTEVRGYYEKAIKGNAQGQFQLACSLEDGDGIAQNKREAVFWYKKSASRGYTDAQINLGWCYLEGEGTNRNINKAISYFKLAANKGDGVAQYCLGQLYYFRDDIQDNNKKAVYWLKKAIVNGDNETKRDAYEILAECYEKGYGVVKSQKEAARMKSLQRQYARLAETE